MIIYDFIFCTIHKYFSGRSLTATLGSVFVVALVVVLHLCFIQYFVFFVTGMSFINLPALSGSGLIYLAATLGGALIFVLPFYRELRVKKVLKNFSKKYEINGKKKKKRKLLVYIVAPLVLLIVMSNWPSITGYFFKVV